MIRIPNNEYHSRPEISKSGLDQIDRSPAHFQAYRQEPREETASLRFGTAVHAAVLEPDAFERGYIPAPEGLDRRTKAGKEAWAALESSGKTILTLSEWSAIQRIGEAVRGHRAAAELLTEGEAELSFFSALEGVAVKCRPDWFRTDGIVVDLKTTQDASASGFAKSVASYRYHVQHALYADLLESLGHRITAFVFVAVEKTPPYAVGVYELDPDAVVVGREAYQRNLDTYRRCLETDFWPAYSEAIEPLSLPRWAMLQAA